MLPFVAVAVVTLPLSAVAHNRSAEFGLSTQGWGAWAGDVAKSDAIGAVFAAGGGAPSADERRIDTLVTDAPDDESGPTAIQRKFLRSRATTLEGGTSEIMRNVIGERVLKLPQELRADKGIAWKDIPR